MDNFLSETFSSRGARVGLVATLAMAALFLLVQTVGTLANIGRPSAAATDTITVQGNGQVTLAPDVARISFTVQNTEDTVAEAQEATTEEMKAAIAFIKEQGIEDKDVKTLSYTISPQYSYPNPCAYGMVCPGYTGIPKIVGYQVSETVQVTVRDLAKVGTTLGGLGDLGVENVNGPSFALDDASAGYNAAREEAIKNAKEQAKALAKELGVSLDNIVSFSESSGGYPPPYPMDAYGKGGAMAEVRNAVAPDIQVGENTYSASVSITYEIR